MLNRMILMGATAMFFAIAPNAFAGSLDNLERERASVLETVLDGTMPLEKRHEKLQNAQRRLVDLERMVLRDDSLKSDTSPAVRRAFANYDLTFLAHSSLEKDMTLADSWLEQMGLTTQNLMSAKSGRR